MKTHMRMKSLPISPVDHMKFWMLLAMLVVFFLSLPIPTQGEENQSLPSHPRGDFSTPSLPPPGIIGVAIHVTAERVGDPAGMFIRATHPEGPATKAGLAHGQEILAVDGISIKGKTYREVVSMIRGEVGQPVRLTMKKFSDVREVTVIRTSESQLLGEKRT